MPYRSLLSHFRRTTGIITSHSSVHLHSCAGSVVVPAGAVGTRSAVVALANGTAAAASAMAAVSAATDGVQAKQRALVARLTELEHSATQRRVRLEAEGDSTSGGLSGARISGSGVQEETQELTSMVEQIVSQVDCTVRLLLLLPVLFRAQ